MIRCDFLIRHWGNILRESNIPPHPHSYSSHCSLTTAPSPTRGEGIETQSSNFSTYVVPPTRGEGEMELANYFFTRFIQNMNINTNTQSPIYKAKISPQVEAQLYRQLRTCSQKKYQSNLLHQQLDNVRKWGDDNIEIVITQNSIGNFALGIKKIIALLLPQHGQLNILPAKQSYHNF